MVLFNFDLVTLIIDIDFQFVFRGVKFLIRFRWCLFEHLADILFVLQRLQ